METQLTVKPITKKQILAQFKDKSLQEMEGLLMKSKIGFMVNHRDYIFALYHIRDTELFRQDLAFKNATFREYLERRHGKTETRFISELWAHDFYPAESERLGASTVIMIEKKCGKLRVKKVLKRIPLHSNYNRELIDQAIEAVSPKQIPVETEPRHISITEHYRMMSKKDDLIRNIRNELNEANTMIHKLRKALEKCKGEK